MNHLFSCDSHPVLGPEARRRHHDHRPQSDPQVRLQRVLALRARNKYGLSSALTPPITSGFVRIALVTSGATGFTHGRSAWLIIISPPLLGKLSHALKNPAH